MLEEPAHHNQAYHAAQYVAAFVLEERDYEAPKHIMSNSSLLHSFVTSRNSEEFSNLFLESSLEVGQQRHKLEQREVRLVFLGGSAALEHR